MGKCLSKSNNQTLDFGTRSGLSSIPGHKRRIGLKDYNIKSLIGSGTTSKVFLAEKITNKKHYAIKVIQKKEIKLKNQSQNVRAERKMLEDLNHPFLVKFHHAFQTGSKLHLVLEFANGGDLLTYIMKEKLLPEDHCRFYASEILCALEYLHEKNIIFRGLKPEDILLDSCGHIKISDFGLAKSSDSNTSTFCGSPLYLAPEIIKGESQTLAVDYWSFGVLLFEMMCGTPPFWEADGKQLLRNIIGKNYKLENHMSLEAKDLIKKLLNLDPTCRLGTGPKGIQEIKDHPFFKDINWKSVLDKKTTPPFVPFLRSESDTTHVDTNYTTEIVNQYQSVTSASNCNSSVYDQYTYVGAVSPYINDFRNSLFKPEKTIVINLNI